MTEPARSLLGAEVFLLANKAFVSAALLAASTMRVLTAGRSILGGGRDDKGGEAARQVKPGVQLLLLPAAPVIRSLPLSTRGEPVAEMAGKIKEVGGNRRRDTPRPCRGGDEGAHRWQPHV